MAEKMPRSVSLLRVWLHMLLQGYRQVRRAHPVLWHAVRLIGQYGFSAMVVLLGTGVIGGWVKPPFEPRVEQGLLIILAGWMLLQWRRSEDV
jgi:hypothetical protein